MRKVELIPMGFPCTLAECPNGLFYFNDELCFKADYVGDVFIVDGGSAFWGGVSDKVERSKLVVQPVIFKDFQVIL